MGTLNLAYKKILGWPQSLFFLIKRICVLNGTFKGIISLTCAFTMIYNEIVTLAYLTTFYANLSYWKNNRQDISDDKNLKTLNLNSCEQ